MLGWGKRRLNRRQERTIAVMMARYLERGYKPLDAWRVMQESSDRRVADAARSVVRGVEAGESLDEAMERDGRFSRVMVEVARAAQQGGARLFDELANTLEFDVEMRKKWRGLMITAGVYVGIALAMSVVMAWYVAPTMVKMAGEYASGMAQAMVEWKRAVEEASVLSYVLVLGSVVAVVRLLWGNERYREALERVVWRLPMVGRALYLRDVASVSAFLGLLTQAKIPFSDALEMSAGAASFLLTRNALHRWADRVRSGLGVDQAFDEDAAFWPRQMRDFIHSGIRSGALGKELKSFAEILREEVMINLSASSAVLSNLIMALSVGWSAFLFVAVVMMSMLGMMDRIS